MPQGRTESPEGRIIHFNDDTHPDFSIPTTGEVEKMSKDKLEEAANILAYGLIHGSGANVKLAFPFAYVVAKMCEDGEKNPINLVRQLEQDGASARLGTVTINW